MKGADVEDSAPPEAPTDGRGCAQCVTAEISRRGLLRGLLAGAGVIAAAPVIGGLDTRVAWAADSTYTGDTLVVLSLRGGMDGMSVVAPVGDPHYASLRPTIAVPTGQALQLDSTFGLHPALSPILPLFQSGKMAAVHATGLPQPNMSHFAAMAEMEEATPGSESRTGWLDRTLSLHTSDGPFGAVEMGSSQMPTSLVGPFPALGMYSIGDFSLAGTYSSQSREQWSTALDTLVDRAQPMLRDTATLTLRALSEAATLAAATYTPANGASYPNTGIAQALENVAQLIKANVGARVITVDMGDWDMHVGLGTVGNGWMHDQLTQLGPALAAFATDLGSTLDRVTLVTLSEFGRRTDENASGGLDHGWGNVMLLMGGNLVPGVHGRWPGLAPGDLVQNNLKATTDYRAVLADILMNRCGASVNAVRTVFPKYHAPTIAVTTA